MNKKFLVLLLLIGCDEKNEHLTQGDKKLLNPPIIVQKEQNPCESKVLSTLLKYGCSQEEIEKAYKKDSQSFFQKNEVKDPLELAVLNDQIELFQFLEREEEIQNLNLKKAFHRAIEDEKIQFISYFLRLDPELYFELFTKLNFKKLKVLEILFKKGSLKTHFLIRSLQDEVYFPLRWIAEFSPKDLSYDEKEIFNEIMRLLLEDSSVSLDFRTSKQRTLLHLSALYDNAPLVSELLRRDPSLLRQIDYRGYNSLQLGILKNSLEVFDALKDYLKIEDYLHENLYRENALTLAIRMDTPLIFRDMVKELNLEELNSIKNLVGKTLLHLSVEHARSQSTFYLLKKGLNPSSKDIYGRDALYFVEYGLKRYPLKNKNYRSIKRLLSSAREGSLSDEWTSDLLEE